MKYKSNYIEKINLFPVELQDKILNIVFEEHKTFLKKIDYNYEVYSVIQDKIDKHFSELVIKFKLPYKLPLYISCLNILSDKDEVLHMFDDDEEPIVYINKTEILNDIFNLYSQHNMDEDLFPIELNEFKSEEDKIKDKDLYDYMQWSSRIFTIGDAIILLMNEFNIEILIQNEEYNIPLDELYCFNHRFLECVDVVYRDNKVILEWFNGS
jgi:hypothetical protein